MLLDYSEYTADMRTVANADLKYAVKKQLIKPPLELQPSAEERAEIASIITEEFYEHFGEFPDAVVLYHLCNYILLDFIKDTKSNKHKQEYSFKTARQQKTLRGKEKVMDDGVISIIYAKRVHNRASRKMTSNYEE